MKIFAPYLLALALLPLHADLLIQPNDRVLVACELPLDQGGVSEDIAAYFLMCQPIDGLEVIGLPGGDEGIEQFMKRVPTDMAAWNPTVAIISHGLGDGRSGKNGPDSKGYTFYHPTYLNQTLDALKKIGVRTILLGSSSAVDSTLFTDKPAKAYNDNLADFRDLDRDIATKAGLPFVDIFAATSETMAKAKAALGNDYMFGGERGTMERRNAQLVEAWAFLKALGADGTIGTITVDLAANTAASTPGQKIISVQNGAVNIESTRYPFCFTTSPPYPVPDDTSKIVPFFPFNQDLNRYLLVVKGLTAPKAKVTWGTESREISSVDLAQGVNLAAVFAGHTPFDHTFEMIVDHIWQRQRTQFIWTNDTLAHLDDISKMAPGAPVDQLIAAIHAQDAKNGADVKALVVPIQHTIKIEPEP